MEETLQKYSKAGLWACLLGEDMQKNSGFAAGFDENCHSACGTMEIYKSLGGVNKI
jgi:hypothetical protein